jgi:transposase
MTIIRDLESEILRRHFVDRWGVNTIAAQLGVHHSTVDRVLSQAGLPKVERTHRSSKVDAWIPFVLQTLEQYPRLTAARLYGMVVARGYQGCQSHFRARVAQLRPRRQPEAYLRLRTLPGEQAQVDWAHFGHVTIGRARRPLMAFVMVLSFSRMVFLRFYLNARADSFLDGHVGAFEVFGGVPRVLLYDNLKSAVLERRGDAIRFHPTLLELSAHYRFEPRPVAVARGNEKGRVERAIRYIRDSFYAARAWTDLADLNSQADVWCAGPATQRPCPQDPSRTVAAVWAEEREQLIAMPATPFPSGERIEARAGKTPYVRFDLNDYSVPHAYVQRTVTVIACVDAVRVLDGMTVLASHRRAWGKGARIENEAHIAALVAQKRRAREHRSLDRIAVAAPASSRLLQAAAAAGRPLTGLMRELERLLDRYGSTELEAACLEALAAGVAHHSAVHQVLERRRDAREMPPPIAVVVPDTVRNLVVTPSTLTGYDRLGDTPAPMDPTETGP